MKRSKKMEGELRRLRKGHSEATAEAAHFRNLHVKGIMEYSRRKANFERELEEHRKCASDRIWVQAAKISSLRVELSVAQERISQLEGSSSWLLTRADSDREWSKKVSILQQQLQNVEASYDASRWMNTKGGSGWRPMKLPAFKGS